MLLLAVAKALINLSSGNAAAKESIVNEGGVRSLLPHLLTKTEELTRAFCVLLKVRAPPATPPAEAPASPGASALIASASDAASDEVRV